MDPATAHAWRALGGAPELVEGVSYRGTSTLRGALPTRELARASVGVCSLAAAELLIRVDGADLDVTRGDGPADLTFAAGHDIRRLISGELAPDRAIATGVVEVLRGRAGLLDRFASTFHLAA